MSHSVQSDKPNISSSAALWAVLIFVGLLVGAINFVKAMSHDEDHGGGHGAATEQHDATSGHGTSHGAATEHHANDAGSEHAGSPEQESHEATPAESHQTAPAEKAKEEVHH